MFSLFDEARTDIASAVARTDTVCALRLSQRNRTIIVSIHQPRFAIFRLFDRLTLLAAGNIIYQGKSSEALDFFQTLGMLSRAAYDDSSDCLLLDDSKNCNIT